MDANQAIHYTIPISEQKLNKPDQESDCYYFVEKNLNFSNFFRDTLAQIEDLATKCSCDASLNLEKNNLSDQIKESLYKAVLEAFKEIESLGILNDKKKIVEAKEIFKQLARQYYDAGRLSEFHCFRDIARYIVKSNAAHQSAIFSELLLLKELNEALLKINHTLPRSSSLFDPRKLDQETFLEINLSVLKLIKSIDRAKQQSILEMLERPIDKSLKQQMQQIIQSLCIHELNQLSRQLTDIVSRVYPFVCNKKSIIFTCSYGTGHKITANAIQTILKASKIDSSIYDLSTGALLGRDRFRFVAKIFGINYEDHLLNSVDIFNEILKNQLYFLVNTKDDVDLFIRKLLDVSGKDGVAPARGLFKNAWEKTQIREILLLENPDHIITTYHMDLNPIIEVARELNIPVLHVPTDYDMKFQVVFDRMTPIYTHFKSLVPSFDVEESLKTKSSLTMDQLVNRAGIPLRPEFYQTLSKEEAELYRQQHAIEKNEKVLYLSAGGNGQSLPHPERLANSPTWDIPLRVKVIAGKNRGFVEELRSRLSPKNGSPYLLKGKNPYVSIEIVVNPDQSKVGTSEEFFIPSSEISKILDISDAAIAKAGGLSTAELLFKGVPILFDHRKNLFSWELFNTQVVKSKGRGLSNYHLDDLEQDLRVVLNFPKEKSHYFYFKESKDILCQTVLNQIKKAKLERSSYQTRAVDTISALVYDDLVQMTDEELDKDWKLTRYFGEVKVITSDVTSARFQRCQQELAQIGLLEKDYTIFAGVQGSSLDPDLWKRANNWSYADTDREKQGRMGCFMSHYYAIKDSAERLKQAQEKLHALLSQTETTFEDLQEAEAEVKKYQSVLVIEDNTGFGHVTGEDTASLEGWGRKLRESLNELPEDWDMFYFVTMADNWGASYRVSPHLLKLNYGVLTKCYAVNAKMYTPILEHFESILKYNQKIYPVDHALAVLQKSHKCYTSPEALAYRFSSTSEVQQVDLQAKPQNWQPEINSIE